MIKCVAMGNNRYSRDGSTHPTQFVEHALVHATLLEIDSRTINNIADNLLVNSSDRLVRHLAVWMSSL